MDSEFKVTGIESLMETLKSITSPDFADNALREGLMQAGRQVQGIAKRLCPVDTGNLRNSIEVTAVPDGAEVGTSVEYAPYVEMGTSKQTAQPYLRPAAQEHSSTYKAILKKHLQNG